MTLEALGLSRMNWHEVNEEANELTRRGISLATAGDFEAARTDFETAILLRESLPWQKEARVAWGLSAGWINRGDSLTALTYFAEAALSYEQGARVLGGLELTLAVRGRAGILWSNHGLAVEKSGGKEAARLSFRRSLAFFEPAENFELKLGLATARLHLSRTSAGAEALREARAALNLVKNEEGFLALELDLKLRHQLCVCLCEDLLEGKREGDWIAEVTDLVEDGLKMARDFEREKGGDDGRFREVSLDLFRLGLRVYRVCQPQFFCEFLRESLEMDDVGLDLSGASRLRTFFRDDLRFLAVALDALREAMVAELDFVVIGEDEIKKRTKHLREMRAIDVCLAGLKRQIA